MFTVSDLFTSMLHGEEISCVLYGKVNCTHSLIQQVSAKRMPSYENEPSTGTERVEHIGKCHSDSLNAIVIPK